MSMKGREIASERHIRKYLISGSTGAITPEIDELTSEVMGYEEDVARDTAFAVLTVSTSKTFHLRNFMITNREAGNIRVEFYDGTTLIFEMTVSAGASVGATDLKGITFTTAVNCETQGAAHANGVHVNVGGVERNT